MAKIMTEAVIATFRNDTLVASLAGETLKEYQMKKHGWTEAQWKEYYDIYVSYVVEPHKRDIELVSATAAHIHHELYQGVIERLQKKRDKVPELRDLIEVMYTESDLNEFLSKTLFGK